MGRGEVVTGPTDEDGNPLRRDRDGSLVLDHSPIQAPAQVPEYPPGTPCAEPSHGPQPAAHCRCCWSEIKAGDRPITHLGQPYQGDTR